MPYTIKSTNLPSYIKKLSLVNKKKWISIFNSVYKKDGEKQAFLVANTWLKKHVKKKQILARTKQIRERISFEVDTSSEFIKRTDDGDDYISFKLADNLKDDLGLQLPEFVLRSWEKAINENPIVGDIDHEEYDKLLQAGYSDEQVKEMLRNKSGIAKTIKAIYKKGKLWIRAIIDKRYRNLIAKSKGVSMEAIVTRDADGNVNGGDILGFTFGIKHTPVVHGTGVHV